MTFIIPNPQNKRFFQTNRNDFSGNLSITKNINLDDEGYIRLSSGVAAVMTTDDDADFDDAEAMNIGDGELVISSDEIFSGTVDYQALDNLSSETNVPTPGVEDDVIYFNDSIVASDNTTVAYQVGTTWTDITGLTISGTAPTVLELFDGQNSLMIGHSNRVDLVNTSWSVTQTLVLPAQYKVSSMFSSGSIAYIGTRHDTSGEARVFLWDGTGGSATESYGIEAFEIAAMVGYSSSVALISSDGRLLRFNGGGFEELAVWPVYPSPFDWSSDNNDYSRAANRGLVSDGNLLYANVSSQLTSQWKRNLFNFPGGVWCFDPAVGLYHRHSPSYTRITQDTILTSDVNTTSNQITVSSAPVTGTPIRYNPGSGDSITELDIRKTYFAINVDATTIQLATSEKNALAGTAIDLSDTGNNTQFLLIYNTTDYGVSYVDNRMSVAVLSERMRNDLYAERLAFSANLRNKDATSQPTVLCTPVPNMINRGYFVLPRLYSSNAEDNYSTIEFKHRKLQDDDKIIVKYQIDEFDDLPLELDDTNDSAISELRATWTSTNTMTAANDISMLQVGDEVEIVEGVGAGTLLHISDISGSTITFDEDFIFASNGDKCLFNADRWTKLGEITKDNQNTKFRLDKKAEFVRFKIELRGVNTTIYEIQVGNKTFKPTSADR